MESSTKNRQPAETLRALVARAYGPDLVPDAAEDWVSELSDGWFNVTYRIRLRSHTDTQQYDRARERLREAIARLGERAG